jgi:serine/threonine-protein kinase
MASLSPPELCESIRSIGLLGPEQQDELTRELLPRFKDIKGLANELLRRGWFTPFQINKLAAGKAKELALGPYVLLNLLGEGGMGKVYKAEHRRLRRPAALKIIRSEHLSAPGALAHFHREAEAAARLDHPNIVRVYDANESDGTHFIAMEFIEGTDLARLVKKNGPLPVATACDYALQAALGLEHAHARGMVHRDIKPSNLLLADGTGVVKLLDMGIARLDRSANIPLPMSALGNLPSPAAGNSSNTVTAPGMLGTPDFVAPEQARDARKVDARADLYSLGCSLYYLLTGRVPFKGTSSVETLMQHQLDEAKPLDEVRSDVPAELSAIVRKLMAKRVEDRYATAGEVVTALTPFLQASEGIPWGTAAGVIPAAQMGGSTATGVVSGTRFRVGGLPGLAAVGPGDQTPLPLVRRPEGHGVRIVLIAVVSLVSLFGGIAVLIAAMRSDPKPVAVAPPATTAPLPAPSTPAKTSNQPVWTERKAAEKLLQLNAKLEISGRAGPITAAADLPSGEFHVVRVELTQVPEKANFTDESLAPLQAFPKLEHLVLTNTPVTGTFFKHLNKAHELQELDLAGTDVTSENLKHLTGARKLKELNLSESAIKDGGLDALANFPELVNLDLSGCRIGDTALKPLESLKLEKLNLRNTHITDKSVDSLKELKTLQHLDLIQTSFTRDGVDKLRKELPKCKIEADPGRGPGKPGKRPRFGDMPKFPDFLPKPPMRDPPPG